MYKDIHYSVVLSGNKVELKGSDIRTGKHNEVNRDEENYKGKVRSCCRIYVVDQAKYPIE